MLISADILIANLSALGAVLVALLLVGFVASRVLLRAVGALLRRLDGTGELARRWTGQLTRLFVVLALLVTLGTLAGAVALTFYEVDAAAAVRRWVVGTLLADPAAVAWTAARLTGVVFGAPALYFLLRSVVASIGEAIGRTEAFVGRRAALDLVVARLIVTLRSLCVFGALWAAARTLTDSESVLYPLAVVTYVAVGVSLARAVVAVAHMAIEVLFEVSDKLQGKRSPLRYIGRMPRLAGVTRRVVDYFVYVGTATMISHQLAPGTLLAEWGQTLIRVIAILYVSRVVVEVVEVMLREALAARTQEMSEIEYQQKLTLVPVATSLARYGIYIFSFAMALGELGLDTTPLFAAAGLMGIAVGLGAQAIVSDLVQGFFILFEGLFLVGHKIKIGEFQGNIEEIGVRVTKIRDDYGVVHAIPNGEIRAVSNHSQGHVNAIVEFGVPHEEDLARVFAALKERFAAARLGMPEILDDTAIVVQELRESCVWLRTVTRAAPGQDDPVCEAIRYEIKAALAEARVAAPHAYQVVRYEAPRGLPPAAEGRV
ncbi:MAG: mechanosensitive ion channel [Myxococcales bacterium]|nr:mechanosensitive ion channel [Myxococcales bacterium]